MKETQILIENLLDQEEIVWLQRARANWLLHGDRNTSFFHKAATTCKKRNCIKRLLDETCVWREDMDEINSIITGYFGNLFTSQVNVPNRNVLDHVHTRVTTDMNERLMAPYSAEEVKKALFYIGYLKAPGPDGLHAIFYKRFWPMFDDDLVAEVLSAVNSQVMPQGWNDTTIVMIPKVQTPEKVSQFRPISLCNVVYKVISKMIATRLTLFLSDIISPTQSAFVPGRLITDNVLIAYESLHTIKQKKTGKEGWCAVKLDMHKAYDRVEWVFLEAILLKLGFHANWVNMVML